MPRGTRKSLLGRNLPWYKNGSALALSLISYWPFSEAEGSRGDLVGSNHLTDNNTVGSVAGFLYTKAATLDGTVDESLTIAHNSTLETGDIDFWMAAWFFSATATNSQAIISHYYEFALSSNNISLAVFDSLSANVGEATTTWGNNVWNLVIAYHSATSNQVGISLNGAAFTTAATTGAPHNGSATFTVGSIGSNDTIRIGPLMFGKSYVPTATDVAFLYNGGSGRR